MGDDLNIATLPIPQFTELVRAVKNASPFEGLGTLKDIVTVMESLRKGYLYDTEQRITSWQMRLAEQHRSLKSIMTGRATHESAMFSFSVVVLNTVCAMLRDVKKYKGMYAEEKQKNERVYKNIQKMTSCGETSSVRTVISNRRNTSHVKAAASQQSISFNNITTEHSTVVKEEPNEECFGQSSAFVDGVVKNGSPEVTKVEVDEQPMQPQSSADNDNPLFDSHVKKEVEDSVDVPSTSTAVRTVARLRPDITKNMPHTYNRTARNPAPALRNRRVLNCRVLSKKPCVFDCGSSSTTIASAYSHFCFCRRYQTFDCRLIFQCDVCGYESPTANCMVRHMITAQECDKADFTLKLEKITPDGFYITG